jgi:hypothetical protein
VLGFYSKIPTCTPSESAGDMVLLGGRKEGPRLNALAISKAFLPQFFVGVHARMIDSAFPFCRECEDLSDLGNHFLADTWMMSTQNAVGELKEIQKITRWEWLVEGVDGFVRYLNVISNMYKDRLMTSGKMLDLIDHSKESGILAIGGRHGYGVEMSPAWLKQTTSQNILEKLRAAISTGMVTGIRLLGCSTGDVVTLKALADLLGTRVWGTRRAISQRDFNESGLRPEVEKDLLVSAL